MESRLSIITLGVQDLEQSYQFYHQGLGFPTSWTPEPGQPHENFGIVDW